MEESTLVLECEDFPDHPWEMQVEPMFEENANMPSMKTSSVSNNNPWLVIPSENLTVAETIDYPRLVIKPEDPTVPENTDVKDMAKTPENIVIASLILEREKTEHKNPERPNLVEADTLSLAMNSEDTEGSGNMDMPSSVTAHTLSLATNNEGMTVSENTDTDMPGGLIMKCEETDIKVEVKNEFDEPYKAEIEDEGFSLEGQQQKKTLKETRGYVRFIPAANGKMLHQKRCGRNNNPLYRNVKNKGHRTAAKPKCFKETSVATSHLSTCKSVHAQPTTLKRVRSQIETRSAPEKRRKVNHSSITRSTRTSSRAHRQHKVIRKSSQKVDMKTKHSKTLEIRRTNQNSRMIRNKKLACYYCGKLFLHRIVDHLSCMHGDQLDVASAKAKKGTDRKKAFILLKNKGSFVHNLRVYKGEEEEFIPVRRKNKMMDINTHLPCLYCYGFYQDSELWRHNNYCLFRPWNCKEERVNNVPVRNQARLLLAAEALPQGQIKTELTSVNKSFAYQDDITEALENDEVILRTGAVLLDKSSPLKKDIIIQSLRELGQLKIQCKVKEFKTLISGTNFDQLLNGVKILAGHKTNEEGISVFEKPKVVIRLKNTLKQMAIIMCGIAIRQGDAKTLSESENFLKFMICSWVDKLPSVVCSVPKVYKLRKKCLLFLTEDIKKLLEYLEKTVEDKIKKIKSGKLNVNIWHDLAHHTLAWVLLLNKPHGNEVTNMLISSFKDRPVCTSSDRTELALSFSRLENHMLDRMDLVQTQNKQDKKTSILLTPEMVRAVDCLIETREDCGIPPDNKFVFPNQAAGHFEDWQVLNTVLKKAVCKHPELMCSTTLEKYHTKICKILMMTSDEKQRLLESLAQDLHIPDSFEGAPETCVTTANMSLLLVADDEGCLDEFRDMKLEEINIEEACQDVSEEESGLMCSGEVEMDDFDFDLSSHASVNSCDMPQIIEPSHTENVSGEIKSYPGDSVQHEYSYTLPEEINGPGHENNQIEMSLSKALPRAGSGELYPKDKEPDQTQLHETTAKIKCVNLPSVEMSSLPLYPKSIHVQPTTLKKSSSIIETRAAPREQGTRARSHAMHRAPKQIRMSSLSVDTARTDSKTTKGSRTDHPRTLPRNKQLACYYCGKLFFHRIVEHLSSQHADKLDVAMANSKKGIDRKKAFILLKNKGSFVHNLKVYRGEEEMFIPCRRTSKNPDMNTQLPCVYCYGFYKDSELWRHCKQGCLFRPRNTKEEGVKNVPYGNQARLLLAAEALPQGQIKTELTSVNKSFAYQDDITEAVENDEVILRTGAVLLDKSSPLKKDIIIQSLRELGQLKIQCKVKKFKTLISGTNFDQLLNGVKMLAGHKTNEEGISVFEKPELANSLGNTLKKMAIIMCGIAIRQGDAKTLSESENFLKFMDCGWVNEVTFAACDKPQSPLLLLTQDLIKLIQNLEQTVADNMEKIKSGKLNVHIWRNLAHHTLAWVLLLNKPHGEEVTNMLISSFKDRPVCTSSGRKELALSFSGLEKHMLDRMDWVQTRVQQNKKVTTILTPEMVHAIDCLIGTRAVCGISPANKFVFPDHSVGHLVEQQVLDTVLETALNHHPLLMASAKLEKYLIRICRILMMTGEERQQLLENLAHLLHAPKSYKRVSEAADLTAKMSHVLVAINEGHFNEFYCKRIEDINIEDVFNDNDDEVDGLAGPAELNEPLDELDFDLTNDTLEKNGARRLSFDPHTVDAVSGEEKSCLQNAVNHEPAPSDQEKGEDQEYVPAGKVYPATSKSVSEGPAVQPSDRQEQNQVVKPRVHRIPWSKSENQMFMTLLGTCIKNKTSASYSQLQMADTLLPKRTKQQIRTKLHNIMSGKQKFELEDNIPTVQQLPNYFEVQKTVVNMKPRQRKVSWTKEENELFSKVFSKCIRNKTMATRDTLMRAKTLLPNRTIAQIRTKVHNIISGKLRH